MVEDIMASDVDRHHYRRLSYRNAPEACSWPVGSIVGILIQIYAAGVMKFLMRKYPRLRRGLSHSQRERTLPKHQRHRRPDSELEFLVLIWSTPRVLASKDYELASLSGPGGSGRCNASPNRTPKAAI